MQIAIQQSLSMQEMSILAVNQILKEMGILSASPLYLIFFPTFLLLFSPQFTYDFQGIQYQDNKQALKVN